MLFPSLNFDDGQRDFIDSFKGYNHTSSVASNEFFDMANMTSDKYPLASPRPKRVKAKQDTFVDFGGAIVKNEKLWYVHGTDLVCFNGYGTEDDVYNMDLSGQNPLQLVSMGTYILFFPDQKYFNTIDPTDCGDIKASFDTSDAIPLQVCDDKGVPYLEVRVTDGVPETPAMNYPNSTVAIIYSPSDMYNASGLVKYDPETEKWLPIDAYMCATAPGIGSNFAAGDAVKISGITGSVNHIFNDKIHILTHVDDDVIVFKALAPNRETPIHLVRDCPDMDYVIEANNRLWGCKYVNRDGYAVNEIYASALGDFRNWYKFEGISTDSYAASVGSDGAFTGAIAYKGYPLFFKDNTIHKVYGSMPSNFQIQTTTAPGVADGSYDSLKIVNGILYYLASNGVYAYDGSTPYCITDGKFGDAGYFAYCFGVGGSALEKYYIAMTDKFNKRHLFAFDTKRGLWHKEDNLHVVAFVTIRDTLYLFARNGEDYNSGNTIWAYNAEGQTEPKFHWYVETGIIGTDSPYQKYVSRVDIRMSLAVDTTVAFSIEYDSSGTWEQLYFMRGTNTQSFGIPLRPRRCDHFRLRIDGKGDAKIYSISKIIKQGSDIN